jgi:hypothetical protein
MSNEENYFVVFSSVNSQGVQGFGTYKTLTEPYESFILHVYINIQIQLKDLNLLSYLGYKFNSRPVLLFNSAGQILTRNER